MAIDDWSRDNKCRKLREHLQFYGNKAEIEGVHAKRATAVAGH